MVCVAAHALELLLLHEAQDLSLQGQGQVADLVEEERAVVRHLRLARPCAPDAPVKAPFSWPKSSFSRSASGMAAQLMATKGPLARAESWWRARLISSLPVPLSPRRSTVASVAAARWMASIVSLRAGSSPRTRGRPKRRWYSSFRRTYSVSSRRRSMARSRSSMQVVGVHGLGEEVGGAVLHGADRVVHGAERGHDDAPASRGRPPVPPAGRRSRCPRGAAGR